MKTICTSLTLLVLLPCFTTAWAQAEDKEAKKDNKYEFKIETLKEQPTMTVRFKVAPDSDKITAKYGEVFTSVFTHVISNGGQPAGAPFGRYHSMKDTELDIEAGIPIAKALDGKGEIKSSSLPGGRVLTTIHFGPYTELEAAHDALQKHLEKKGHKATGPVWEAYLTDPSQEADQSKWQTKLFIPIAEKKKDDKKEN